MWWNIFQCLLLYYIVARLYTFIRIFINVSPLNFLRLFFKNVSIHIITFNLFYFPRHGKANQRNRQTEGQCGLVVLDSQSKGCGFDSHHWHVFLCNPEQVALLLLLRPSNERLNRGSLYLVSMQGQAKCPIKVESGL